jgi:predicted Rdx family selenoprotein
LKNAYIFQSYIYDIPHSLNDNEIKPNRATGTERELFSCGKSYAILWHGKKADGGVPHEKKMKKIKKDLKILKENNTLPF